MGIKSDYIILDKMQNAGDTLKNILNNRILGIVGASINDLYQILSYEYS